MTADQAFRRRNKRRYFAFRQRVKSGRPLRAGAQQGKSTCAAFLAAMILERKYHGLE